MRKGRDVQTRPTDVWQMRTPSSRRPVCGDAFPFHAHCAARGEVTLRGRPLKRVARKELRRLKPHRLQLPGAVE